MTNQGTNLGKVSPEEISSINGAAPLVENTPTEDSSSIDVPVISIEEITNDNVAVGTRRRWRLLRKDDTDTINDMDKIPVKKRKDGTSKVNIISLSAGDIKIIETLPSRRTTMVGCKSPFDANSEYTTAACQTVLNHFLLIALGDAWRNASSE